MTYFLWTMLAVFVCAVIGVWRRRHLAPPKHIALALLFDFALLAWVLYLLIKQ